jgi:hypothetical protein
MAGELRVDTIKNTSGLGTVTVSTSGPIFTGSISGVSSVSDASGGYLSLPPGTIITVAASVPAQQIPK